ncbi:MAG: [Abditibacteriota bacterium]|nr:[FeFe] hydrogenase H-cluster radical SAM maturase HydE [Abditibacteriota bacterium]
MLDKTVNDITDSLKSTRSISREELRLLLESGDAESEEYLFRTAGAAARETFGSGIYLRGLVEFTSYCKNDCLYCGLRRSNRGAERYRLTEEEILACCETGAELGFGTFVLQGGEDPYFTDDRICGLVENIKGRHPSCAVTLSIGEKPRASYQRFFDAGADRYLLRHETANEEHYRRLHPAEMSPANRKRCLFDLKDIGFQTGCGFMVGSPFQTTDTIYDDIEFMRELGPHMIGIGPFIAHKDTPFAGMPGGSVSRTLRLLSVLRLLFPKVLLPATTALGTADPRGREKGILAGANVLMPNLSPVKVRKKYMIYDGKICTGEEAAECRGCLKRRVESIGCHIAGGRGDHPDFER